MNLGFPDDDDDAYIILYLMMMMMMMMLMMLMMMMMLPISLKFSEECGSPENSFLKADFVHKAGLNESLDDALMLFSLLNPVAGELVMMGANSR